MNNKIIKKIKKSIHMRSSGTCVQAAQTQIQICLLHARFGLTT